MEEQKLEKRAKKAAAQAADVVAKGPFAMASAGPALVLEMAAIIVDLAEQVAALTPYKDEG